MPPPILHHQAAGIHPGAFVQDSEPDTSEAQDGVLWINTSTGPPHELKRWDAESSAWQPVQMDATGYPLPAGHRVDSVAGLGTPVLTAVQSRHANTHTRVASLWTPEGNFPLPSGWDGPPTGFAEADVGDASIPFVSPAEIVWTSHIANSTQEILAYGTFTLPAGTVVSAHLQCAVNDTFLAIHINGTAIPFSGVEAALAAGMDIDTAPFLAGEANVLAFWVSSDTVTEDASNSGITWTLTVGVAPPEEKLRLYHATDGDQMLFPLIELPVAPAILVGKDPDSELPAFCPPPNPRLLLAAEQQGFERTNPAGPLTCTQVVCGVATALRDELYSTYSTTRSIINSGLNTLGGALGDLLVDTGTAFFVALTDGLDIELAVPIRNALNLVIKAVPGITGSALQAGFADLNTDQKEWLRQTCWCALSCADNQVTLTQEMLQGWQTVVAADTVILAGVQRDALAALIQYGAGAGLSKWAQVAQTGAGYPLHDCDAYTCP